MKMHTNWQKSAAKAELIRQFECGELLPNDLPNLRSLYETRPDLFSNFQYANFAVNVKNLAKKYMGKFEGEDLTTEFDSKFVQLAFFCTF